MIDNALIYIYDNITKMIKADRVGPLSEHENIGWIYTGVHLLW